MTLMAGPIAGPDEQVPASARFNGRLMAMYRNDDDAHFQRLQVADREAAELRRENEAMRKQLVHQQKLQATAPPTLYNAYKTDLSRLPPDARAPLAFHRIRRFPVWAAGVLNFITLGFFGLIHFSLLHNALPKAAHNDPSGGKAIGFSFIPYFNMYWVFFNSLRLCDRLDLQYRVRDRKPKAPRGMMIACSVVTVIPYLNLILMPILWTIGVCRLQSVVNEVADMDPHEWATDLSHEDPGLPALMLPPQ